jgi:hypothetical protein
VSTRSATLTGGIGDERPTPATVIDLDGTRAGREQTGLGGLRTVGVEALAALSGYLSSRMPEKLAELPSADDGASPDGWHELAVANPTFLLERLGSECTDVQGLRELTVNGLDAIAALGADRNGRVVWDLDWGRFDASGGRVRKLSVIDTGTGMTAGQLRYYINQLAASGREQSLTGNFGVGAKVAAGSRNPQGSSTAPGIRAKARWCASSATPTGAGAWNRSAGQTAAPSGGPIADPPQRHAQAHRLGDARPGGVEQLHPDHRQRHRALASASSATSSRLPFAPVAEMKAVGVRRLPLSLSRRTAERGDQR